MIKIGRELKTSSFSLAKMPLFIMAFIFCSCVFVYPYTPLVKIGWVQWRAIIPVILGWGYLSYVTDKYNLNRFLWVYLFLWPGFFLGTEILNFEIYLSDPIVLRKQLFNELIFAWHLFFAIACLNILFVNWNKNRLVNTIFSFLLHFIISVPLFAILVYWSVNKTGLKLDAVLAVYQTTLLEAYAYLSVHIGFFYLALLLGVYAVLFYLNHRLYYSLDFKFSRKAVLLIMVLLLGAGSFCENSQAYSGLFYMFSQHRRYIAEVEKTRQVILDRQLNSELINAKGNMKIADSTFVLVIGESHNRNHMSAYGYSRNTTPWLDSMKNEPHFVLLKNSYSNHAQTLLTLSQALTELNQYSTKDKKMSEAYSLIEIAKKSGYKVTWLSNQPRFGGIETQLTIIADFADEKKWVKDNTLTSSPAFDENLVDLLPENNGGKNLIVLHLIGSHMRYDDRYPASHAVYVEETPPGGAEKTSNAVRINSYDNSVLYNDHVMSKLFQKAQEKYNLSAFIYFSDHGQELVTGVGHDAAVYDYEMITIPTYMWFSEEYANTYPQKFAILLSHQNSFFTNDLIYDALIGILDIDTPHYNNLLDISSAAYELNLENAKTLHGKKYVKDNSVFAQKK
ncbi:MAG: phosphoethanolamine transferase [Sporomusaceae bacterium]|jgi:heptose-I-phosphate ethanolaminephosphotransferase|nr:phosphoethanolamine transferase [Sporomusaceae bacterium]